MWADVLKLPKLGGVFTNLPTQITMELVSSHGACSLPFSSAWCSSYPTLSCECMAQEAYRCSHYLASRLHVLFAMRHLYCNPKCAPPNTRQYLLYNTRSLLLEQSQNAWREALADNPEPHKAALPPPFDK